MICTMEALEYALKRVIFRMNIQFSTQFNSTWLLDRTLSGATTPGQSGPGSDGNERVLHFPKAAALQETRHQIVKCHKQDTALSVYSVSPADWAINSLIPAFLFIVNLVWFCIISMIVSVNVPLEFIFREGL